MSDATAAIRVRAARRDDLAALVELCAEHAAYERAPYDATGKSAALAQAMAGGRLMLWVAESRTGLLGYAAATLEFSTWQATEYLHLDCLFLRESARGAGLGQRLLTAAAACARSLGVMEMQWQTPAWNENARRFYRRLGAQETDKARFHWPIAQGNAGKLQ